MDGNGTGPTPEKQLLELIEQSHRVAVKGEAARRRSAGALSPSAIRGRFSFLRGAASGFFRGRKGKMGLKGTSKLLAAAAVMLVVLLGWNVAVSLDQVRNIPELEPEELVLFEVGEPLDPVKTEEDYARVWEGRDLFSFNEKAVVVQNDVPQVTEEDLIKAELGAAIEGMVYVSYRKRDDHLVAKIRDRHGDRHTVKSGDRIGGLMVMAVQREKVVVSYRAMEADLPLGGQK